jgi:aspartyl-tRNA synthetase
VVRAGSGRGDAAPEGNASPAIATGEIGVDASSLGAEPGSALPFPIDEHVSVGEDVPGLRYRYLDLPRRTGRGDPARSRVNRAAARRSTIAASSRSRRRRDPLDP